MKRGRATIALAAVAMVVAWGAPPDANAHPDQHGEPDGHLLGAGAFGDMQLFSKLRLTDQRDIVADVGVDPRGTYAYLAHWGKPTCAENSEAGGVNDPDAGVFVVDIADLENPRQVGFIPHSQDSRPGEGVQAVEVSTKFFDGVMLVTNNEQCGKNGRGGVTLTDVTDPLKPKTLSQHFGDRGFADTNDIHSAFAWNDGDNAYVVIVDNFETGDVDILDITNPKRPLLITELNLNTFFDEPIFQPQLGLDDSGLHDMTVKQIDGRWIMLLSYWDGGYVRLDVTDPAKPGPIYHTDYPSIDPLLFERTGRALPPEGNAHQAEFTADNKFFIGTDEDFAPYRPHFLVESGPHTGEYPAGEFGFTPPIQTTLPDGKINGTVVYGGYGCPGDAVPDAQTAISTVDADEERIVVFQRGPVGDPSASGAACFFSEKVEAGQNAGYDAVVIANHHVGADGGVAADARACGSQGHVYDKVAPAVCIGHRAMHLLFDTTPDYSLNYSGGTEPAVGTVGAEVSFIPQFDGWGYVWLFDAETGAALDAYAIPEAHDAAFAAGFGDLTVHEVATDPNDPRRAYLSYYAGGMRALEIHCANEADTGTCSLVETGGFLDQSGNDFWGVEAFIRDGKTIVAGSDRAYGLYLFTTDRP